MALAPYKFNRRPPTEVARLRRLLTLLAAHVGADLDDLVAEDDARRRGFPVDWDECVAVDVDPTTGERHR